MEALLNQLFNDVYKLCLAYMVILIIQRLRPVNIKSIFITLYLDRTMVEISTQYTSEGWIIFMASLNVLSVSINFTFFIFYIHIRRWNDF